MESLRDKAYRIIHEKIITCQMMPGEMIDEKSLIQQTGCGRTPVREALMILARDGLVRIVPRRGIFISDITIKDVRDIYELKREVEPIIVRLYGLKIPEERLRYFQELFLKKQDSYHYTLSDAEFHAAFIEVCDNTYYKLIMNIVSDQSQRIRILTNEAQERHKQSIKEHLDIVDALWEGNVDLAAERMRAHYQNSLDDVMRFRLQDTFVI